MNEYRCLECGAEFSDAEAMDDHIEDVHPEGYGTHPTTVDYRLFHNVTAMFQRTYEDGDVLIRGYEGVVEWKPTPQETCDLVYSFHNRDDRPDGQDAPSLSVGDVVSLNAGNGWVSYSVAASGWVRVHGHRAEVIDGPYRTVAERIQRTAETALRVTGHKPVSVDPPRRFYPWDVWMNGDVHYLIPGQDFDVSPRQFERIIRTSAERRRRHVVVRIQDDDRIAMQATD